MGFVLGAIFSALDLLDGPLFRVSCEGVYFFTDGGYCTSCRRRRGIGPIVSTAVEHSHWNEVRTGLAYICVPLALRVERDDSEKRDLRNACIPNFLDVSTLCFLLRYIVLPRLLCRRQGRPRHHQASGRAGGRKRGVHPRHPAEPDRGHGQRRLRRHDGPLQVS